MDVPTFEISGKDEIATLSASFNRRRPSVDVTMRMFED